MFSNSDICCDYLRVVQGVKIVSLIIINSNNIPEYSERQQDYSLANLFVLSSVESAGTLKNLS